KQRHRTRRQKCTHAKIAPVHQRRIRSRIDLALASQHAATTYGKTSVQTRRLQRGQGSAGGGNDGRPDTYVDLAPITKPDLVPVAVIRAPRLPDQPGSFDDGHAARLVADRAMLVVLDKGFASTRAQ